MLWLTLSLLTVLFAPLSALAQQKMDLEDVNIKGEIHSDERLKFYMRQKNQLKNYVKFRKNYRDIMSLEQDVPEQIAVAATDKSNPRVDKQMEEALNQIAVQNVEITVPEAEE